MTTLKCASRRPDKGVVTPATQESTNYTPARWCEIKAGSVIVPRFSISHLQSGNRQDGQIKCEEELKLKQVKEYSKYKHKILIKLSKYWFVD